MKQIYKKYLVLIILVIFCSFFIAIFSTILIKEKEFKGYVIQDTSLTVYIPDFPSFWDSIKKQKIATYISEHLFTYLYNVELFFRKQFGIRPTPFRWKFWAGKPLLISWNETGDYLVSLQPRPLFQLLILPHMHKKQNALSGRIVQYKNLYYLYKGDKLLISNKETVLHRVILFDTKLSSIQKKNVYIELGKAVKSCLYVYPEENFHIYGKIVCNKNDISPFPISDTSASNISFSGLYQPLRNVLSDVSLQNTILSIIPEEIKQPFYIWLYSFKNTIIEKLYQQILNKKILERSFFFYSGISDKFSNPIPVLSFWFPYESDDIQSFLSELGIGLLYYPYQWGTYKGYVVPIWNDAFCLSLIYYEKGWLICSQESLMAEIIGLLNSPGKNSEHPCIFSVNLNLIYNDIEKIFMWCAQHEFLDGINLRDVSTFLAPWKQFFKEIGTISTTIRTVGSEQETYVLIRGDFYYEK